MINCRDVHPPTPPSLLNINRQAEPNNLGYYDHQGRYCAPATEISFIALEKNLRILFDHQQAVHSDAIEIRRVMDDRIKEMETRIQDAMSLMHYTIQFYPYVVNEWQTAQKTKMRLGVEPGEQVVP